MSTETLVIALRIAGLMMSGIVIANFVAATRWRYRESLADCQVMVRQIFYVHCAYIIAIVGGLGVLCLGWPQLLLADGMGRVLASFFGAFWSSRVIVQLCYYDHETRRQNRGWDLFFLGVFTALSAVFTLVAIYG